MEDMLKGYIIKSRIREADKILLAQPYSPHLFRQGVLPGPGLLLDVLLGKKTTPDAKAAWKKHEKEKSEKNAAGESWLLEQTLPCRRCTDLNCGKEVWKPVSLYSVSQDPTVLWKSVVRRGQDLICWTCRHQLQWGVSDAVMPCDECGSILPKKKFDDESQARWERLDTGAIICLQCQGHGTSRTNTEMIFCNGVCQMERPEYHFVQAQLSEWIAKDDRFLNASKTTFVIRIAVRAFRCQLINGCFKFQWM